MEADLVPTAGAAAHELHSTQEQHTRHLLSAPARNGVPTCDVQIKWNEFYRDETLFVSLCAHPAGNSKSTDWNNRDPSAKWNKLPHWKRYASFLKFYDMKQDLQQSMLEIDTKNAEDATTKASEILKAQTSIKNDYEIVTKFCETNLQAAEQLKSDANIDNAQKIAQEVTKAYPTMQTVFDESQKTYGESIAAYKEALTQQMQEVVKLQKLALEVYELDKNRHDVFLDIIRTQTDFVPSTTTLKFTAAQISTAKAQKDTAQTTWEASKGAHDLTTKKVNATKIIQNKANAAETAYKKSLDTTNKVIQELGKLMPDVTKAAEGAAAAGPPPSADAHAPASGEDVVLQQTQAQAYIDTYTQAKSFTEQCQQTADAASANASAESVAYTDIMLVGMKNEQKIRTLKSLHEKYMQQSQIIEAKKAHTQISYHEYASQIKTNNERQACVAKHLQYLHAQKARNDLEITKQEEALQASIDTCETAKNSCTTAQKTQNAAWENIPVGQRPLVPEAPEIIDSSNLFEIVTKAIKEIFPDVDAPDADINKLFQAMDEAEALHTSLLAEIEQYCTCTIEIETMSKNESTMETPKQRILAAKQKEQDRLDDTINDLHNKLDEATTSANDTIRKLVFDATDDKEKGAFNEMIITPVRTSMILGQRLTSMRAQQLTAAAAAAEETERRKQHFKVAEEARRENLQLAYDEANQATRAAIDTYLASNDTVEKECNMHAELAANLEFQKIELKNKKHILLALTQRAKETAAQAISELTEEIQVVTSKIEEEEIELEEVTPVTQEKVTKNIQNRK